MFPAMTRNEQLLKRELRRTLILVEGEVGVGKTTLIGPLASYIRRKLRLNPVPSFESMRPKLFGYFKQDTKAHGAATQMLMLGKRLLAMQQATATLRQDPDAVVLMDRSLAGDRAFATMLLDDAALDVYMDESLAALNEMSFETPRVALYLTAAVATLKLRIEKRGNKDEIQHYLHDDPTYLERLHKVYEAIMTEKNLGCPVERIVWEEDHPSFSLTDEGIERLLMKVLHLSENVEMDEAVAFIPPFEQMFKNLPDWPQNHETPWQYTELSPDNVKAFLRVATLATSRKLTPSERHFLESFRSELGVTTDENVGDQSVVNVESYIDPSLLRRDPTLESSSSSSLRASSTLINKENSPVEDEPNITDWKDGPGAHWADDEEEWVTIDAIEHGEAGLKRGDLVSYQGELYYFQPNGSACYLYRNAKDVGDPRKSVHAPTRRAVVKAREEPFGSRLD